MIDFLMKVFGFIGKSILGCLVMIVVLGIIGLCLPNKGKKGDAGDEPQPAAQTQTADSKSEKGKAEAGSYDAEAELKKALADLDALVGLEQVKREIRKIVNQERVKAAQREQGYEGVAASRSLHMIFTGNPGTGKTTVARIVARIFRALGIVKNDHVVETDRSGLVGSYMGETAIKTSAVIDEAVGIPHPNNDC